MRALRACALVAAATLITGCGGGGSTSGVITQPQPTQQKTQLVSVSFTIVVPTASGASLRRVRNYVSASTKSATIAVGSATPTVVNCTTTCSGTVSAPVGSDTFTMNLYSGTNGSGNLLSTGTLTQTIVANEANSVNVTFNGVVSSLAVVVASTVTPGTAGSVGVTMNALDASGNVIVGPGSYVNSSGNPLTIALDDSDTSGKSTLSTTSITQPTSGIELNYTAAFDTNPTLTASAAGLTSANATVTFPAPTFTAMSVWSGTTTASTVTETLTGTNFVAGSTTVPASGFTVSNVAVSSSTSLSATFNISAASFGTHTVSLTTGNGTSGTLPFAIGTSSIVVTLNTDSSAGTPAGTGSGTAGDLRSAILAADATPGSVITFNCGSPCTITLSGPLPPITANAVVDGGTYGNVIINGASTSRAFWAESGTVVLANLEIENATAQGGNGGAGEDQGGGGGAGLGAGLFVDAAIVSAVNDYFLNDGVIGGNGGDALGAGGGDGSVGGGGLGGSGGGTGGGDGSGGGGGILGAGAQGAGTENGGAGGVGFANVAAPGTASSTSATPATPATAGYGGGGGGGGAYRGTGNLDGGNGGNGGFGGGGGGGGFDLGSGTAGNGGNGGNGGFGGGGGGASVSIPGNGGNGGNGGAGGGGGAGFNSTGGTGGALATIAGGSGAGTFYGGGGAAAGPAIFVNTGTLTTTNSGASGCTATGGAAGGSPATAGGSNATPVFNYGGTVNGSTTAGPVASALGTTIP